MPRRILTLAAVAVVVAVAAGAQAQNESNPNFGNPANGVEPFVNNLGLGKHPNPGAGSTAQGGGPCALLTADDVAGVLGGPVKVTLNSTDSCYYQSGGTKWQGNDAEVHFGLEERATFDANTSQYLKMGMYHPLSGVGDQAYLSTYGEAVNQSADVRVVKGNTHFSLTVEEDPNHARSAVTLARKVADRIK